MRNPPPALRTHHRPGRGKAVERSIAVALIRVSTDRERQELGADAQRAAIEAWAAREGVRVASWHLDEVSGAAPLERRPGLLDALAAAREIGAGRIVFQRWDRLSRDPSTAAMVELEAKRIGAQLVSCDGAGNGDDPTAQLMRDMLLAFARFERAMIKARIKAALRRKQERGEVTGAPRFGQRLGTDGVHVIEHPTERFVIDLARGLAEQGKSIRAIVAELAAQGVTGRRGKPLTRTAVHNLLRRAAARPTAGLSTVAKPAP